MENICKERNPQGCSDLIPSIPCRYYIVKNGEKVYIDVNPDDYKIIGQSKDCYYLTKK